MRRLITAVLSAGLLAATAAAPAGAATARPAAHHQLRPLINPGSGWYLDTASGGTSAAAQGAGNQIVLTGPNGTRWNTTGATHGYKVMNNNGLCWERSGTALDLASCAAGNGNQMFTFSGSGVYVSITCYGNGATVGTFGQNSGRPVDVENSAPDNTWVLGS